MSGMKRKKRDQHYKISTPFVFIEFKYTESQTDRKLLEILTYVGLGLSILGSVITIISHWVLTERISPLFQIRVSLTSSLLSGQITFLVGINATANKGACVAAAALMQYFFMAALCWMLVEGIYLYLYTVKVFNVGHKMLVYHLLSWGIPAVFVSICLGIATGINGIDCFVNDKYCWLSSGSGAFLIFVTFVVLVELANTVIVVRVIKEMASMQHISHKQIEQARLGIRACLMLMPLLGITWLFGLLTPVHTAFLYVNVILNSTQGFLIFALHCWPKIKRTISQCPERQTALVALKVNRYNVDVAAPSETRLPGYDSLEDHGYIFFWSGRSTQERREAGVGFAVRREITEMLDEEPVPINDRIMTMRLSLQRRMYATLISVYAPTMTNTEEVKEEIYSDLR
ncbi:adhesion G-protein coupled receptor D1-like [Montipora capricornis]|uniref:adhesion G-protein coupled receptor D1-like n=1 Tax=Montipora capricornis TaxID=246305 RepID=UPI0035F1C723